MPRQTKTSPYVAIGKRIHDARTRAGITQGGLSAASGVSRETISALERGVAKQYLPVTVAPLWRALGLSETELQRLLTGQRGTQPDPRIETLRADVENAPLSDRVRQTILTLIESELAVVRNKV